MLAGVSLVAGAALLGSMLLGSGAGPSTVWAASRDLAAGSTVRSEDWIAVAATLPESATGVYVDAAQAPTGTLTHAVPAGAFLPSSALESPAADRRAVTLPVEPGHLPGDLGRGDRVDLWASAGNGVGAPVGAPRLVLSGAVVARVSLADSASTAAVAVVLDVPAARVATIVAAVRGGAVDLVAVPLASG